MPVSVLGNILLPKLHHVQISAPQKENCYYQTKTQAAVETRIRTSRGTRTLSALSFVKPRKPSKGRCCTWSIHKGLGVNASKGATSKIRIDSVTIVRTCSLKGYSNTQASLDMFNNMPLTHVPCILGSKPRFLLASCNRVQLMQGHSPRTI
jgi:hypothetical protein